MADWHCSSWNATDAGIVVMEVLLSVVIGAAVQERRTSRVLDRRYIVGRIRTLEFGGRVNRLGTTRGLIRAFRDILKVKRMTNGRRAASNIASIASLAGGEPING